MKYIDSEKLIAEIERLNSLVSYESKDRHDEGLHDAYKAVKNVIASLQQEQPMPNSTELIAKWEEEKDVLKQMDFRGDKWRLAQNAFMDGVGIGLSVKREQPEVDLDFQVFAKEMDAVFNLPKEMTENTEEDPLNWEYAIARHFYELGLKARKK